ncbi:WD repeat-containing protein 70-like [Paramacrobiotus metropolitanus]|uniref:WD repeat-containing protein 70-like n=1 Tax=Paramacrobiotus metropolitanus TaxID=2943436 RepID=UPI002445A75F|nr:WD repeat-containing protein 70-like [Paramacrobiotus metropolitanus]
MAEDDLEEMRHLRHKFHVGLRPSRDAGSDDDEEAHPTAAEPTAASTYVFGTTLNQPSAASAKEEDENETMAKMMGFSGFASGAKKSRTFDIDTLVNEARQNATLSSKGTESDSDDDAPGPPLPPKPSAAPGSTSGVVGPSPPPSASSSALPSGSSQSDLADDDSDVSDDEESADVGGGDFRIPCSYDLTFEHGDKAITALNVDSVGARFATGSVDYEVKLWDFGGMQANLFAFRTCKPCESHAIHNVSFSNGGEQVLVVSGNAQAKVIDRDGFNVMECPKGFQYLNDMAATKGHIGMLTSGWFSPKVKSEFCTSSYDGTLRIWSIDNKEKHKVCLKLKSASGLKTVPTTCAYSKDGKFVAAGCQDGSISMWDTTKANFVNPAKTIRNAHQNATDISSICFSYDNRMLCSRGLDDTVKLWDLNMLKKPVFEARGLSNISSQSDCVFSPNDKVVLCGTAVQKGSGENGKLVFLDRNTFNVVKEHPVGPQSVIRIVWHPRLNQIFASTNEGTVKVFFDPNISHNGALLCRTSKKRVKPKLADSVTADYVYTPFALPMYKEEKQRSKQAQFERARKDPIKSQRPELPVTGPGAGGRVGQAGGTLSSFLVRKLGYAQKRKDEDVDPRQALLRHAEAAAKDPYWVSPAYAKTQPNTIFQQGEGDAAGHELGESVAKKQKKF